MAEAIVKFVLGKFNDIVLQEALSLYRVDEQVDTVRRELSRIQAFLKDADKKQIIDERQKHWVKEVKDVAYSIEDVIDTFLSEIPQKTEKSSGMMNTMKKMLKKTKKLPAVHKLVDEIGQIQKKLKEIEESRLRFGITNLGEGCGHIVLPIRPPVLPDIDPDVVGFNADQEYVVKELIDETNKRRSVVSIWGAGGLGKTTLAQKVYNSDDVKKQFEFRAWVTVSQKFELIDILRKIGELLGLPIDFSNQSNLENILIKLHESLRDKKYLIILDDVWSNDLWTQIGVALPDENNGSRVLITTRNFDVAKNADPRCEPYELGYLSKELSLELLLKRALPNQNSKKFLLGDLADIADQFVRKCGGLPLALVVLGGLLSKKPSNYIAWSKVLQAMSWHADGKECSEVIGTSFEDLPFALKSCFMYFVAFPEDHDICAESLLQMWVAEGFIPQEDNRTLEETAESFLEDLVQRSMVQATFRSSNGSIVKCRIHDVLRDLAMQKAKEDNFFMVYSHPNDKLNIHAARRLAIHHPNCHELILNKNLRTLLSFHKGCMLDCSKQRLLKVVKFNESAISRRKLGIIEGLTQLRYLKLSGTLSAECEKEYMTKVIGSKRFLQTLDFRKLYHEGNSHGRIELPNSAWQQIKTLRHIMTRSSLPAPSAELTNLQTCDEVTIGRSWESMEVPLLPNLRRLHLSNESSSWNAVAALLDTLEHLISLDLVGEDVPLNILDMRRFPFYQRLQLLQISFGPGETFNEIALPHVSMLPPHLTGLDFTGCQFTQDPMPGIEKLDCLKFLSLSFQCKVRKMRCSAGGFCQLESLWFMGIDTLEELEIEEGAMPNLERLTLIGCMKLSVPQGLQHLTNLKSLYWVDTDKGNEVRSLCKHVPLLILGS